MTIWISGFIRHPFQDFQAVGTDGGTDAAIVPLVILIVVFLLPLVARHDIQYLFTGQTRIPSIAFQCLGRACLHAPGATPTEMFLNFRTAGELHIGENGSQSNP